MFTLLCLLLSTVNGQVFNMNSMPPPEISMSYSDGGVKKNSTVSIEVVIPENWHVNANKVTDDFLKPSSVEIAARGIKFGEPIWPEPIKEFNEALDLEILVFKGKFQIRIPVDSVEDGYDSLSTNAIFHYQACDNSICLAPAQVEVKIGGASGLEGSSKLKGASSVNGAANDAAKNDAAKNDAASLKKNDEGDAFGAAPILLLFFAFLGGIILNLMPCVLPVLSLKLFSLINQAGESRKRLMALGFATTAGILASFWVLAVIISAIKAGGGAAGWGMQFQSAGFIAFMVVILAAFAMSFFGVFEVWLPGGATTRMDEAGRKAGLGGAFFTGALLVLLSTPCSAPLLGTAMGFAFTATTPVLFLFFTAAGVGLAVPYLLVSIFPAILNVFPKPGKWMVTLQKVMGVLLLATVAWLLWVVSEQAGSTGVALFAIVAATSIACSFALGKFAPPGAAFAREIGAFVVSAVVLAALWFALLAPKYEAVVTERFEARASEQMLEDGWYRYSEELVEEFKKAGRTIFIDVTADWCLTCKANEAAVLSGSEFLRKMDSAGVARVKADWTRETPEVNALLKSLGKSGVPAYAIYPHGDANQKFVFPELLTTNGILEKLP
ncbi:protein-disulfide reductase DsbD family protein [Fibrobacter sp.]|uniref:protein-disulfide reductase DsbD family protein n=1 Tax=Fibrobacter sp. TaxID=35828 RepID=UPI003890E35F